MLTQPHSTQSLVMSISHGGFSRELASALRKSRDITMPGRRGERHFLYILAAQGELAPSPQRGFLLCAEAYAQATLRDFQHYQGRAGDKEGNDQQLFKDIVQASEALDAGYT